MSLRTRRRSSIVVALLTTVAVLATGCTRNPEAHESSVLVNAERRNRGIPELFLNEELTDKAQRWADHMAARGTVSHSNLREGLNPGWRIVGENVGWARSVGEMHSLFMSSSTHRSTMLDRRFSSYGVGVTVVNGRYYTVHVFAG
jgi:uncharacterized protein YkwD